MNVPRLASLHVYPVKACRGTALRTAAPDPRGLDGDRGWMIVDEAGRFLSQRTEPLLALVEAVRDANALVLRAPGAAPLALADDAGTPRDVSVWNDRVPALDLGESAAAWLSRHLGRAARLVRLAPEADRRLPGDGAPVGFTDAYPLLVLSDASLADLNARLPAPVTMDRFRPNLVVSGCAPYAEDGWRRIRIGEAVLRLLKPCTRCVATTVDPVTGAPGKEPLATLARYRRTADGVVLGMNAVWETPAPLTIGAPVEVLESGPPAVAVAPYIESPPSTSMVRPSK